MRKRHRRRKTDENAGLWDGFLFKFSSRVGLGVLVILVFLTLVQCTVEKPEAPQWTTQLTVPVVNRTYQMEELIGKINQDGIAMDTAGNITFSISEDLDTVRLEDGALTTSDLSYSVSEVLGPVSIDAPSIDPVSLTFSQVTGLATSLSGGVLPAMSFNVTNDMPAITSFSQATISNGTAVVIINNDLGVDLDLVTMGIYSDGALVVQGTFPTTIVSGQTDSLALSLAGKTISNVLQVNADCHTPGGTVTDIPERYIETKLAFEGELKVSAAQARIPAVDPISFSQPVGLSLEPGESIDTASLAAGTLSLAIANTTNLLCTLSVSIPELKLDGISFTLDSEVPAGDTVNINHNLSGYVLVPSADTVNINAVASVPGSGEEQVPVDQNDSFGIDATLSGLSFSSVTGVYSSSEASFAGISFDIDIPTGFDSLELVSAVLTLEIENGINLPGNLDILLIGNNGKTLSMTGEIAAGQVGSPTLDTITNTEVAAFLSPIPSQIQASGSATFGDDETQGTITADDFVFARVSITAPLEMLIKQTRIETDIESETIEQDDIDVVTDHVVEARFVYNIINHLPLGATVEVFLAGDSTTLYDNPELTIGPLTINAAPVSASGVVNDTASTGYQEILLTNEDVRVLENATLYTGQELVLEGSDGQTVKLVQNDYITVVGRIEVEYHFDGEL